MPPSDTLACGRHRTKGLIAGELGKEAKRWGVEGNSEDCSTGGRRKNDGIFPSRGRWRRSSFVRMRGPSVDPIARIVAIVVARWLSSSRDAVLADADSADSDTDSRSSFPRRSSPAFSSSTTTMAFESSPREPSSSSFFLGPSSNSTASASSCAQCCPAAPRRSYCYENAMAALSRRAAQPPLRTMLPCSATAVVSL